MTQIPRFVHLKFKPYSLIPFSLLCFIIFFADTFTLRSISIRTRKNIQVNPEKLIAKEDQIREQFEDYTQLIPPFNSTRQLRISWFKKNLPNFKIFQSNNLTNQFDNRVVEFFSQNQCEVQFFMTWISPAKLFGERELLTIESMFKSNPNGCLIILSRSMDSAIGFNLLKPFLDRRYKVQAVSLELYSLFKNTPAELWFEKIKKGEKDPGAIPLAQNLSNLIRLVVLYKYGGVYLDTDFIILRDFSNLKNSIGAQSVDIYGNWTRLNNAVLVFDKNHPLLYKFIEEFASNYDGNKWGHNGPYLVSRVVQKLDKLSPESNFTVMPPAAFYPVDWIKIIGLFLRPRSRENSKWVEAKVIQISRGTYGLHLWHKQSNRLKIEEGSIVDRLRLQHCIFCTFSYSS